MLSELFPSEVPVLRLVRGFESLEVAYLFGDASGEGFAASWTRDERQIA